LSNFIREFLKLFDKPRGIVHHLFGTDPTVVLTYAVHGFEHHDHLEDGFHGLMGFIDRFQERYFFLINRLQGNFCRFQERNRIGQNFISLGLLLFNLHVIDFKLFFLFTRLVLMFGGNFSLLLDRFNQFFHLFFFLIDFHLLDF